MKKILIITTIGGFLTQFEKNDVKLLIDQGYEVHYASNFNNCIYYVDEEFLNSHKVIKHHINIEKSPLSIKNNISALKEIRKIIKDEEIQVVHCHNPMGGVLGRLASILGKRKLFVMYTAHGFHFYKGAPLFNWIFYYTAELILAKFTDIIITINDEDYVRAKKFNKHNKVYKIPGVGVDIDKFNTSNYRIDDKKKELGIPDNAFVVFSVGEVNSNKNHSLILSVMNRLKTENIFYGICGDGPLFQQLEKKLREENLMKQIKLFGYRNDIPEILKCADCFVFPSKREGFGIAAIEAMASGVPVIASDCRGTREYMEDKINGFVCDGEDKEDSFMKAIMHLKNNKELQEKMRIECKKKAQKFSIDETGKIMREVYNQLP